MWLKHYLTVCCERSPHMRNNANFTTVNKTKRRTGWKHVFICTQSQSICKLIRVPTVPYTSSINHTSEYRLLVTLCITSDWLIGTSGRETECTNCVSHHAEGNRSDEDFQLPPKWCQSCCSWSLDKISTDVRTSCQVGSHREWILHHCFSTAFWLQSLVFRNWV